MWCRSRSRDRTRAGVPPPRGAAPGARILHRHVAAIVCVCGLLTGCRTETTRIVDLLDHPNRYDREVVRIEGTVGPALGPRENGVYRVDDGTGTLPVVVQTGVAPRESTAVGVEGQFRWAYALGGVTTSALLETRRVELLPVTVKEEPNHTGTHRHPGFWR
jgi:hypothetical protein